MTLEQIAEAKREVGMSEVVYNPMTIEEVQGLLPGLTKRALKEEFKSRGLWVKGSRPMMVTVEHFNKLMRASALKPEKDPLEGKRGAPGFVYFVACDLPDGTSLVKIGYATDVRARLSGLQVSCPLPVRLVAAIPASRDKEKIIHRHFAAQRQRGEWFALSSALEREIMEGTDG